jgi:hypothetical protein
LPQHSENLTEQDQESYSEETSEEVVEEIGEVSPSQPEQPPQPSDFLNESLETNLTLENVTLEEEIQEITNLTDYSINETTIQHKAVIGEPVKWEKIINIASSDGSLSIEKINSTIPSNAENITIKKLDRRTSEEDILFESNSIKEKTKNSGMFSITGGAITPIENTNLFSRFLDVIKKWFESIF